MLSGYWKDSSIALFRAWSEYGLMTHIMKISGIYIVDGLPVRLAGTADYLLALALPLAVIGVCLAITHLTFRIRDIHTQ
ncbi:hypothetical protein GCM10020370_65180 [Paenibacillus hodogayensis]